MTLRQRMMSLRRGKNSVFRLWKSNWTSCFNCGLMTICRRTFQSSAGDRCSRPVPFAFAIEPFLAEPQTRITDVRSDDLELPGRRNERLWRGHVERKGIPEIVVGERVTNQNRYGIRFLPRGASRAPHAQVKIAAFLLLVQQLFKEVFLQEVELRRLRKKLVSLTVRFREGGQSSAFPSRW